MKNLEVNTLNINSNSLLNIATFRQEDNATLMLELYKNGQSIDLTGQKIILGAERSDGSIIEQEEDISTNENIVTIKLKKNILAVNGLVKMQLTLSDREGTMSTTSFNINVDRKILGAENIKASNDIETINSLVLDLKTNVNKAITDTKDKASTLLSGLEDTANSVELKVNALTDISNGLLKNLENQCKDSTIINTELSNNIKKALPINTELKENIKIGQPLVQEMLSKNTELQASLEKTKEFINGLDRSQNIPQLRLDVTELQNGLKSNQALAYTGSSISAENTLEGRTEGMIIKGKTLYKKKDGNYTDIWEEGVTLESFGEKEGNKISILSNNKNLFKSYEELISVKKGQQLYLSSKLTDGCTRIDIQIDNQTDITVSDIMYWREAEKLYRLSSDRNKLGISLAVNRDCNIKLTNKYLKAKEYEDIQLEEGTQSTSYEHYKCDKKDILIKEPLRENDVLYEDNGKVKVYRPTKQYTFTGDENLKLNVSRGDYIRFVIDTLPKCIDTGNTKIISNNFPSNSDSITKETVFGYEETGIVFCILKSKLTTPDVEGFKAWLKANPTTVVYQLAEPVTEIVENCVDIDLDTFEEKTYFSIENSLQGTLDFKVPSNIASIVQANSKAINEIYNLIDTLVLPNILQNTTDIEMLKLEKLK